MKVKELAEILKNCDPEMDVLADVHGGLWDIKDTDISEWCNEDDFDKSFDEMKLVKSLNLIIDCNLSIFTLNM